MAKFEFHATLAISVEADNESHAQKLAWALLSKRIDEQQYGDAAVTDWVLGTLDENEDQTVYEGANENQEQESSQSESGGSRRGFAAMDPEKRREIARKGGESSHGGGRGGGSNVENDKQLETMEQFLETHQNLPEKGRREIEAAIEKRRAEIEGQNTQH